jgi:putative DNA primase/helicase
VLFLPQPEKLHLSVNRSSDFFIPSTEWQEVPDWVQLPPGWKREFHLSKKVQVYRWPEPVPGPETVIDKRTGQPQCLPRQQIEHSVSQPETPPQEANPNYVEQEPCKEQASDPCVATPTAHPIGANLSQHASLAEVEFPPKEKRPTWTNYNTDFIAEGRSHKAGVYYHWIEKITSQGLLGASETDSPSSREASAQNKAEPLKPFGQKNEVLRSTWICSPLEVKAIARTQLGYEHSYILDYIQHGKTQVQQILLPQSLLVSRPDELAKVLRSRGVSILHQHATEVRNYLDSRHVFFSARRPEHFWDYVKTTGWHRNDSFVLPNQIIGRTIGVYFDSRGEIAKYEHGGTFADWQEQIATPCLDNPYLVFALCCSLAGPLLKHLQLPGIGFHLLGDSTSGKTTALILAASAWGPPDFLRSWRSTINALETQCTSRSDTILLLDESHLVEPRHLDLAIYLLIHGASKARMNRDTTPREIAHWRLPVLSCGERSLETHIQAGGLDLQAGQAVRLVDIPLEATFGIFDSLHHQPSGAKFADKLCQAAAQHYGHAGPAFVGKLIQSLPSLSLGDQLTNSVNSLKEPLSSQQARVWRSFALVALAGQLATSWKILPWRTETALEAATKLFGLWLANQSQNASSSREHAQICKAIVDFVDTHLDSRFSNIDWTSSINQWGDAISPPITRDRAGYWKDDPDTAKRFFLFTSAGLRQATKGHDFHRVLQAIEDAEAFLKTGANQKSIATRIPNENRVVSLYHIDLVKLQPQS